MPFLEPHNVGAASLNTTVLNPVSCLRAPEEERTAVNSRVARPFKQLELDWRRVAFYAVPHE